MKLFNKTIDRQLFKQYLLASDLSKQEVVVKIFNPYGNGTWFILNSDPNESDYLWAIVDLGYGAEIGSVSRSELEEYRNKFGFGFERDLSFEPVNAEELYAGLLNGEYYVSGGNLSRDQKLLNRSEDYEVRYVKGKSRKSYKSKFDDGGDVPNDPMIYYFYDEEGNQITFTSLEKATLEAKKSKQQKLRDNLGAEYFLDYKNGGDIDAFSDNQQMIMNQNIELEHHHEELEDILEDKVQIPAWVVAKMATATQSVSDITHYLSGKKELIEEDKEDDDDNDFTQLKDFDYSSIDPTGNNFKNTNVVEPINAVKDTKVELTKKFTNDALGNLKGFLKGMEGVDLREDYTFDYNDKQYEIEPIINSDENGVSNAVFTFYDGDGEAVGEVNYSRQEAKQKFTANSTFFNWNNTKFEDGGFMNDVYANGGEIAKAEILGLSKNIMGTTDIEMKITGMRKHQDFIVYPIGKDDAGSVITIQSNTRIGQINLVKGVGVMSQSHSSGAYFIHLQMDKLTSFTLTEKDLTDLKLFINKTSSVNAGNSIVKSDNSGASRILAKGGVIYYNNDNERLSRPNGSIEKEILEKVAFGIEAKYFAGNFGWKAHQGKLADGYLYNLDDYDKNLIDKLKLKQGEKVFRYVNRTTAIGGMMPFIKINLEKALLYFPVINSEDEIVFETRGVNPLWVSLIEANFEEGGNVNMLELFYVMDSNGNVKNISKTDEQAKRFLQNSLKYDGSLGHAYVNKADYYMDKINPSNIKKMAFGGYMTNVDENRSQIRVGDKYKSNWSDSQNNKGFDVIQILKQNVTSSRDFRTKVMITEVIESSESNRVGIKEEQYRPNFNKLIENGLYEPLTQRHKILKDDEYSVGGKISKITEKDVTVGSKFKIQKGTEFIIDKVYEDSVFGVAVESSMVGGRKGDYRDTLVDFVAFLNEEKAVKTILRGGKTEIKSNYKGSEILKKANLLAKEIRKDNESWQDAKKRAFTQLKKQNE